MQHISVYAFFLVLTLAGLFGCIRSSSRGSPKIQPFSFHDDLRSGQKATVTCAVNEGNLPLTFEWKKNGEDLESSENVRIRDIEDVSILVINPLTKDSAGNYTCVVSNDVGNDEYTARLFVNATSEDGKSASCESPSECIKISDCRFFRNSTNQKTSVERCGDGEDWDRQVCCLNYTLYLKSKRPSSEDTNYVSCKSPSVCIPIIRCLSHRSSPNWQTTGETCGPGVFALRQICCLGPTLPPRRSRPPKERNCGKSLVSNPLMPIDNDGTSQDGAWPWVVSIEASFSGSPYMKWCTGILVDHKHVLVTAYCLMNFYSYSNSIYRVRVPNKNLQEDDVYHIKEYVVHPRHDFEIFSGNIAVLKLHDRIESPDVIPVCLPNEELLNTDIAGLDATLAGYHNKNVTMHFSHMDILSNSECFDAYNASEIYSASHITEDIICSVLREDYKDNCRMDRGGALMIRRGQHWFAVGIFSYCLNYFEHRLPMIFLRLSSYFDWIKSVIDN